MAVLYRLDNYVKNRKIVIKLGFPLDNIVAKAGCIEISTQSVFTLGFTQAGVELVNVTAD